MYFPNIYLIVPCQLLIIIGFYSGFPVTTSFLNNTIALWFDECAIVYKVNGLVIV